MTAARVILGIALGALALVVAPTVVGAQGTVRIDLPLNAPFPAAPEIFVRATGFADSTAPRSVRLQLVLDNNFGLVVYDSTIVSDNPRFVPRKLLPENRDIYARATVFDGANRELGNLSTFAGRTGAYLTLLGPKGVNVRSRTPTFSWRSAPVMAPPGPWVYELLVTNRASPLVTRSQTGITDTVFFWADSLDANTSYRWKVIARLPNGLALDSATASSGSSFVVAPTEAATATLLYQNFPNPFPSLSSPTTCIWFDLQSPSTVELSIHDVRGHRVKTIIPGQLPGQLAAGRYGRLLLIDDGGCDPRLAWDGSSDNGRVVPAGLYLLRMRTDAGLMIKKIVFRGR